MTSKEILLWLAILGVPAWQTTAHAAEAHVHGQAELEIVAEGPDLTITLRSPLDNLLGFERAPTTDGQKAAAQALLRRLREPGSLVTPTPAAACVAQGADVEAPVLEAPAAAARSAATGKAGKSAKAAKADEHDDHAEVAATWRFRCAQPAQLKGLEVKLFEVWRRLQRIEASIAGPRGQSAARLTATRRSVTW